MPESQPTAPPRFLYFDLGNVLFTFDKPRAVRQMAEVSGVALADIRTFFEETDYQKRLETGLVTPGEIHADFCQRFGVDPKNPRIESLSEAGSDIFQLNAPIIPLLTRLALANHRMGILSNTSLPHWEFLNAGQYWILRELFEVATLSFEVKSMKPDPEIYAAAAELVKMKPSELFFTDDLAENVEAARAAGWQATQFTSPSQLASDLRDLGITFNY